MKIFAAVFDWIAVVIAWAFLAVGIPCLFMAWWLTADRRWYPTFGDWFKLTEARKS